MDTYNETKKLAIYKWRDKNRERYNDICLKAVKKYNEKNKTEIQEYKRKYWIDKKDIYKVESTIFRKILL